MVTLKIDDKTFATWQKQASDEGLSVEEWLKDKTNLSGETSANEDEFWHDRLISFANRHRPTGTSLDDSREGIYE